MESETAKAEKAFHTTFAEKIKKESKSYILKNKSSLPPDNEKIKVNYKKKGIFLVADKKETLIRKLQKKEKVKWHKLSPNENFLMYFSMSGGEFGTLFVVDVKTGKVIEEKKNVWRATKAEWLPNENGYHYTSLKKLKKVIKYHKFRDNFSKDQTIFERASETSVSTFKQSKDGKHLLIIESNGAPSKKNLFIYSSDEKKLITIADSYKNYYSGFINSGYAYIRTDRDSCSNNKIIRISLETKKEELVVPEKKNKIIEAFGLFKEKIVIKYLRDVEHEFFVIDPETKEEKQLPIPKMGTVTKFKTVGDDLHIHFESYVQPTTIFKYSQDGTFEEIYRKEIEADIRMLEHKKIFYTSHDGTKIPMYIIHRKDLKLDGTNPTILYGYGGFRQIRFPRFNREFALWVKKGGVIARSHIRGGGEYGGKWNKAGILEKKENTFEDFHFAMKYLFKKGYTSPEKLGIFGSSQGGLLASVTVTRYPDELKAAIIGVPLTDMVNYTELGMGKYWKDEYGDPENPEHLKFLLKYSPYHNVKEQEYPAVLIKTGAKDTHVGTLHAKKFAKLLQEKNRSVNGIYLHIDPDAGHSCWVKREMNWEFFFKNLGLEF